MRMLRMMSVVLFIVTFLPSTGFSREVLLILDPGHGGSDQGGWSGDGFKWGDRYVPEDAYTYDIAKRVERRAEGMGFGVVFTVRDVRAKDHTVDSDEHSILSPRKTLIFNLLGPIDIVDRGRKSLAKRMKVTEIVRKQHPKALVIFISIHVDITEPYVGGMHIFTVQEKHSLEFARSIVDEARGDGYEFMVHSRAYPMINDRNRLYVMRHGLITPRVLIEVGNFNNIPDRLAILRSSGREHYAKIIIRAVQAYVEQQK